jgi:hypothetical protein
MRHIGQKRRLMIPSGTWAHWSGLILLFTVKSRKAPTVPTHTATLKRRVLGCSGHCCAALVVAARDLYRAQFDQHQCGFLGWGIGELHRIN